MKKYIIPFLALGLACSCVEDEGNYTFTPMNQVTFDGIQASYSTLAFIDVLEIDPKVEGSIYGEDESNYEYTWTICHDAHTHDVIGTERKLSWKTDIAEGEYTITFTVKDKNTDIEKAAYTKLTTSSPFNTGFLILGKDMSTGLSALDMLTMPPNRDTTMVENITDVAAMNINEPSLIITAGRRFPGMTNYTRIWLSGENKTHCLLAPESESVSDLTSLGDASSQDIIEIDIPYDRNIVIRDMFPHQSTMMRCNMYRGYITNDLIVYGMIMTSEYFVQPCNRYSATSEELFKPYPLCFAPGANYSATGLCMAYDMDNECFVKLPYNPVAATMVTKGADFATDQWKYDLKAENRNLVYGENGFEPGNSYMYAIVKNAGDDNGTRYIYRWRLTQTYTGEMYTSTKDPLYTVDPAAAPDFDKASHYMFSSNRTAVLYSVGNRLYQYDYARKMCAHYDFPAEITYLAAEYASEGWVDEYLVATYSDQDKGMIYKMSVPNNPNAVEFDFMERMDPETKEMVQMKWPTRLKVTDIEWKTN